MKPKVFVLLGVCLTVASLLFTNAFMNPIPVQAEPRDTHSVNQALGHALLYIEKTYNMNGLTRLEWQGGFNHQHDLYIATHEILVNKAETLSELQAQYANDPDHAGFTTEQLTLIIHTPANAQFSHQITLVDGEKHATWSGKIDVDGHVTEYTVQALRINPGGPPGR